MNDGIAANYHAIRLTFIYLLLSGFALIFSLSFPFLEDMLYRIALVLVGLSLLTFGLPVIFSDVGLSDSRSIIWPYKNLAHRIRHYLPSRD